MQPLLLNGLAGLFSGVETAFTGTFRLGPTNCADRWRISAALRRKSGDPVARSPAAVPIPRCGHRRRESVQYDLR